MYDKLTVELFGKARLIAGRLRGENTAEEDAVLTAWLEADPMNRQFYQKIANDKDREKWLSKLEQFDQERAFRRFLLHTRPWYHQKKYRVWVAAILLMGLAFSVYLTMIPAVESGFYASEETNDIEPGRYRATLSLSSGKQIDLNESREGIVVSEQKLAYANGTTIDAPVSQAGAVVFHTLHTPRGGKYQVLLPDGTRVWLNASSTLVYPSRFPDDKRKVEIVGEAYFEVAADPDRPFFVASADQVVQVLGTTFNINAYPDEQGVTTTLVNGAVKVKGGGGFVVLSPGEAAVSEGGRVKKTIVDVSAATAWKSDRFYFDNTSLEVMMRQLSRWYDIDIEYENEVPEEYFTGKMSKRLNLMEVLDFLKGSQIRFKLDGRTLFISQ